MVLRLPAGLSSSVNPDTEISQPQYVCSVLKTGLSFPSDFEPVKTTVSLSVAARVQQHNGCSEPRAHGLTKAMSRGRMPTVTLHRDQKSKQHRQK